MARFTGIDSQIDYVTPKASDICLKTDEIIYQIIIEKENHSNNVMCL